MKATTRDLHQTIRKITATFDAYGHSNECKFYNELKCNRLDQDLKAERYPSDRSQFLFDICPYPYQQKNIDRLLADREVRGLYQNLVVAAIDTGKTVIAALDCKRFCKQNIGKANRLLFIDHRKKISKRSYDTFAGMLKVATISVCSSCEVCQL